MKPFLYVFTVCGLFLISSCDVLAPRAGGEEETAYVVESYQITGRSLQPVYVSRTASLEGTYSFETQAVEDAVVWIELLSPSGEVDKRFPFHEKEDEPGVYVSDRIHFVQPLRTYRLQVDLPGTNHHITAQTTTPDAFRLLETSADTLVYQSDEQLTLTLSQGDYPEREDFFSYAVQALEPSFKNLTPFFRDILADQDTAAIKEFEFTSSPLLQEANYTRHSDGTISMEIPWLPFVFFGPTRVGVRVLDENLYDFYRSQAVQQGGFTLAPGAILNVIEHVEGGTGVFGSYSRQYDRVYLKRPEG